MDFFAVNVDALVFMAILIFYYRYSDWLLKKKYFNKAILTIFCVSDIWGVVSSKQFNTVKDRRDHLNVINKLFTNSSREN